MEDESIKELLKELISERKKTNEHLSNITMHLKKANWDRKEDKDKNKRISKNNKNYTG